MNSIDVTFYFKLIGICISLIGLFLTIRHRIKTKRKKLKIEITKMNVGDFFKCQITLTNTGNKPIYIRKIELYEKNKEQINKVHINYEQYRKETENNPLNPDDWRHIVLRDDNYISFYDYYLKKIKTTRFIIIDSKNNKFSTKWFNQNNLR